MAQTKWPSLLTSITENLKRTGELNRVHNILLIVRKIAKRFEYYGRNVRVACRVSCML